MLKFVLDTNVLVSALISTGGNPALLLDKAGERYTLFTDEEINTIIEAIISFSEAVDPEIKLDVIKSDPDDNKILECAVACED